VINIEFIYVRLIMDKTWKIFYNELANKIAKSLLVGKNRELES